MTRATPRVVCVDLGGVVVRICRTWQEGCAAVNVAPRGGWGSSVDETQPLRHAAVDRYQRGLTTYQDFVAEIAALSQGDYTPHEIDRIHRGWILGDYPGIVELFARLRALNIPVACLSNTNDAHWQQMRETSPAFRAIDLHHASHLLALNKPDPAIYAAFEQATGYAPHEIFFADDLIENVRAAAARGWHAIHIDHTGDPAAQIEQALRALGVLAATDTPCEPAHPRIAVGDMPSPLRTQTLCCGAQLGGTIKARPSDFLVDELPLYELSGEGEHLFLGVQKQDMTHDELVHIIAEHYKVDPATIGTAGKKDRRAVTRQTISVTLPNRAAALELRHDRLAILWSKRHGNKLRTGHLAGNRFVIRVRDVDPLKAPAVYKRLRELMRCGVPNGFGPQRFGQRLNNHRLGRLVVEENWTALLKELTGSSNLPFPEHQRAARLLCDQSAFSESLALWGAGDWDERKMALAQSRGWTASRSVKSLGGTTLRFWVSALQAAIFNRVLDRRIESQTLNTVNIGDIAYRHEGGACFMVDASESAESLAARVAAFEISPTGPLVGERTLVAADATAHEESAAARAFGITPELLRASSQPPSGERRPLRIALTNAALESGTDEFGGYIRVAFDLPAGAFATVVIDELFGAVNSRVV